MAHRRSTRALVAFVSLVALVAGCHKAVRTPDRAAIVRLQPAEEPADAGVEPLRSIRVEDGGACQGATALSEAERSVAEWKRAEMAARDARGGSPDDHGMNDHRVSSKDVCAPAETNLSAEARRILAATHGPRVAASPAWNGKAPLAYMDRIDGRYRLTAHEKELLARNGFVATERLVQDSYGMAFHDVFQSELPVFVSMDALFHAVSSAHDAVIGDFEERRLKPALEELVARLHCALPAHKDAYPPEIASDLDLYLTVARALAGQIWELDHDPEAKRIVALAGAAEGLAGMPDAAEPFVLFGRPRVVDFSVYRPRGRYASRPALGSYFLAATWLSRLELNLVSRSSRSSHPAASPDPTETPREATLALALADLVEKAGALPLVEMLDRAWSLLGGKREDVSITDLVALRKKTGIASLKDPAAVQRALARAIGADFRRTARLHFMPENSPELPAIATVLGPRVVADTVATRTLVHDETPQRYMLHAADMAYALGHDRAKAYLAPDLTAFPTLGAQLDKARHIVKSEPRDGDLYRTWLSAASALSETPREGVRPGFMGKPAYADMRLGSAIVAFGQVRHAYVLVAGQGYDAYGCEIPDGYVEPAPEALDRLIAYARTGETAFTALDPVDMGEARAYFAKLGETLSVLRRIVEHELAGTPLSEAEKRWLGMIAEYTPVDPTCMDSCAPPQYSGWWFGLFPKRKDGLSDGQFIADYYTSTNHGQVAYVGAERPVMGFFAVEQGGRARLFAGPLARGYGHTGPIDRRLTDEDALALPTGARVRPWTDSYLAPRPAPPDVKVTLIAGGATRPDSVRGDRRPPPSRTVTWTFEVEGVVPLGALSLTILDHHRKAIAERQLTGGARVTASFTLPRGVRVEGLRLRVGTHEHVHTDDQGQGLSFGLGKLTPGPP